MRINDKREKKVDFGSLNEGDVFINKEKFVCMKTESTYGDDNGKYENAVRLSDGSLWFYQDDTIVQKVDCELVIE